MRGRVGWQVIWRAFTDFLQFLYVALKATKAALDLIQPLHQIPILIIIHCVIMPLAGQKFQPQRTQRAQRGPGDDRY